MASATALWRTIRSNPLVVNLATVAGATVAGRLISLLTLGYTARTFGPYGYGLVGYGSSVVAYAAILLSPGLVTWGVRAVARDRERAGIYLVAVNLIQLALATLAFGCLAVFAYAGHHTPDEQAILLLSGLSLFQSALAAEWAFTGLEQTRITAGLSLLNTCLQTAGLLLVIHRPDDVFRLPLMTVGVGLMTSATGYVLLLRRLKLAWPARADFVEVFRSAGLLSLMVALVTVLHYANNLIVNKYLGAAELGIFLAAFRLLELASTIPGLVSTVVLPRIARKAAGSHTEARVEAHNYARVLLLVGAIGAALSFAEADGVIDFVYGQKYTAAAGLLRVMAVGVFFNFAITGYTNTLISFGHDRAMVWIVAVSAVAAVGGGLVAVPLWGAMGAAVVVAFLDCVGWLVSIPAYRATVGSLDLSAWLRPLAVLAATIVLSLGLQQTPLPLIPRLVLASTIGLAAGWLELRRLLA